MPKLTDKQLDKLIRRQNALACEHTDLATKLGEAFQERYGTEPSEVDCDEVIDALDYGVINDCSLAYVDRAMRPSARPAQSQPSRPGLCRCCATLPRTTFIPAST